MRVEPFRSELAGNIPQVSVPISLEAPAKAFPMVYFRFPDFSDFAPPDDGSFTIPLALPVAMKRGESLVVETTACPQLLEAIPQIQDIYATWGYADRPVTVTAQPAVVTPPPAARGVGCFFTGGVDSFYSLYRHLDEITHLIYVHGFDIRLDDHWRRQRVSQLLHSIAERTGKRLIEIETNLRQFSNPEFKWDYYHGAALAGVALMLDRHLQKVYIPATFTYADLVPIGSHPLLDPLWSTAHTTLVHDGCEASRVDKLRLVAHEPVVQETLRVCWKNVGRDLNCGVCEKCVRTLIALEILDRQCATFPHRLDLRALREFDYNPRWQVRYGQLLNAARQAGKTELARAIERFMKRPPARGIRKWPRKIRRHFAKRRLARSESTVSA